MLHLEQNKTKFNSTSQSDDYISRYKNVLFWNYFPFPIIHKSNHQLIQDSQYLVQVDLSIFYCSVLRTYTELAVSIFYCSVSRTYTEYSCVNILLSTFIIISCCTVLSSHHYTNPRTV